MVPTASPCRPPTSPTWRQHLLAGFVVAFPLVATDAAAEDCKVETSPGVFVSCLELLDRAGAATSPPPPAPPPPPAAPETKAPLASTDLDTAPPPPPDFARNLTAPEAARLRETKIDWDKKAGSETSTGPEVHRSRGLAVLKGAQEDKTPLGQERLRVDRLKKKLFDLEREQRPWEKNALFDLRLEVKRTLASLADIERYALGKMQGCRYGHGLTTVVKTVRMTASGPVKLKDDEVLAQAAGVDDPVCQRTLLVTQLEIDELNEMHQLRAALQDGTYDFYDRKKLRAAQTRAAVLKDKYFGLHRQSETIDEVARVPTLQKTQQGRMKVGDGERRARPLNARGSRVDDDR